MSVIFAEKLGALVRLHRNKSGLTQKELADLAGIGKSTLFDIEKGKESVRLNTVLRVLGVLNISIELTSPLMNHLQKGNR